jgi:outer membrane protein assembly factor BamB
MLLRKRGKALKNCVRDEEMTKGSILPRSSAPSSSIWNHLLDHRVNADEPIRFALLPSMAMGFIRGLPNLGGPIVTASGLVFIAASRDDKLRAFDVSTGKELWQALLPAGGQATPMSYVAAGRQFVVVAAGGHSRLGSTLGNAVIAFSLPPGTGSTIH